LNLSNLTQTAKTKEFVRQVKSLVDSGEIKSYAIIAEALDWNPSMLSNVINGRQNVPNDKYRLFSEIYQVAGDAVNDTKDAEPKESKDEFYMETIKDLRHSGITLSEANRETASATRETAMANRILAENQRDLIDILKALHRPTVDAALNNPPNPSYVVQPYLDRIAQYGIDRKWWKSFDEGRVVLGKLAHEVSTVKQE
jgi:hypothetical protein